MSDPNELQLPTDLVIESHTDSEADIRAAFDAPEPKDDSEVGEVPDPEAETPPVPETKPPAVVRRSKALTRQEQIQADINALTRTKHETARETADAKRELETLRTQLAAAKAPPAAAVVPPVVVPPAAVAAAPKPKVSDFEDLDEWADAVATWSTAEAERTITAKLATAKLDTDKATAITAANESRVAAVEQYNERGAAFKVDHPDYDDVVTNNQDISVSGVMEVAILTSEHSAEIAYYLGTHPDEAAALAADTKDLGEAGLAFVRRTLEARIARSDPDPQSAAHPVTATAPAARTTSTPKPFSAVASGAAASTKRLDQLTPDEYFAQRNKTELEKTGRL